MTRVFAPAGIHGIHSPLIMAFNTDCGVDDSDSCTSAIHELVACAWPCSWRHNPGEDYTLSSNELQCITAATAWEIGDGFSTSSVSSPAALALLPGESVLWPVQMFSRRMSVPLTKL